MPPVECPTRWIGPPPSSLVPRDELGEARRAPPDRRGGRDVDDPRGDLVARGARSSLAERSLEVHEVVVRREPPEAEHARREVDAVEHGGRLQPAPTRMERRLSGHSA